MVITGGNGEDEHDGQGDLNEHIIRAHVEEFVRGMADGLVQLLVVMMLVVF